MSDLFDYRIGRSAAQPVTVPFGRIVSWIALELDAPGGVMGGLYLWWDAPAPVVPAHADRVKIPRATVLGWKLLDCNYGLVDGRGETGFPTPLELAKRPAVPWARTDMAGGAVICLRDRQGRPMTVPHMNSQAGYRLEVCVLTDAEPDGLAPMASVTFVAAPLFLPDAADRDGGPVGQLGEGQTWGVSAPADGVGPTVTTHHEPAPAPTVPETPRPVDYMVHGLAAAPEGPTGPQSAHPDPSGDRSG